MSDTVQNSRDEAHHPLTEEKKTGSVNYYVIGAVALAMIALLAYQMFGCADCYAPI